MKHPQRFYVIVLLGLLAASGCSALPGLRVLTGQSAPEAVSAQVVDQVQLVMADKTGATDPSLTAAADRIEAANAGMVDIIQIGADTDNDVFNVVMLWTPDNLTQNSTSADFFEALRRLSELTWQGIMQASEGSDILNINLLSPFPIDTLDNGPSFAAAVAFKLQIPRSDALAYLAHRPNSAQDFVNLIADGKMQYESPSGFELYEGQPNHPVFMLAQMQAQAAAQPSS